MFVCEGCTWCPLFPLNWNAVSNDCNIMSDVSPYIITYTLNHHYTSIFHLRLNSLTGKTGSPQHKRSDLFANRQTRSNRSMATTNNQTLITCDFMMLSAGHSALTDSVWRKWLYVVLCGVGWRELWVLTIQSKCCIYLYVHISVRLSSVWVIIIHLICHVASLLLHSAPPHENISWLCLWNTHAACSVASVGQELGLLWTTCSIYL